MESKIYFLTFGAPTKNYHDAVIRLCKQAEKFDLFHKIIGLTEKNLQNDEEFWSKHKDFINSNAKGYGYWIWKPYIINKTLEQMNNNDILLYLDCGCELNYLGKDKFLEFIEIVKNKKILGTSPSSSDYHYTKMDLINFFDMKNDIDLLKKKQFQSGIILMLKCNTILDLYDECYKIGVTNYHFIDDSSSIEKNFDGFIEHRHDQSVLSLLTKKYNCCNYDLDPSWIPNFNDITVFNDITIKWPIWAIRNKTGISILDELTKNLK